MEQTKEIINHNEWAKENLPKRKQMVCEKCGRIVSSKWMKRGLKRAVGKRCVLCYKKSIRKK